jgi:hypothetical protein
MMNGQQFGGLVWLLSLLALVSFHSVPANGNVIAAGGKAFTYDSQNKLVSMNGGAVQIVYDGFGKPASLTSIE